MPMKTTLFDVNGEPISLRWGLWHLQAIGASIAAENNQSGWKSSWEGNEYQFTQRHAWCDPVDGEELIILPGYAYLVSRAK